MTNHNSKPIPRFSGATAVEDALSCWEETGVAIISGRREVELLRLSAQISGATEKDRNDHYCIRSERMDATQRAIGRIPVLAETQEGLITRGLPRFNSMGSTFLDLDQELFPHADDAKQFKDISLLIADHEGEFSVFDSRDYTVTPWHGSDFGTLTRDTYLKYVDTSPQPIFEGSYYLGEILLLGQDTPTKQAVIHGSISRRGKSFSGRDYRTVYSIDIVA